MRNFKIEQVNAFSKTEATDLVTDFQVIKDATTAWNNAGMPVVGTPAMEEFAREYCKKHFKDAANLGAMITVKAGKPSTRKNPYRIENVKNEQGPRKFETVFQGKDVESGEVLFEVRGKKEDAKKAIEEVYTSNEDYKGSIVVEYIHKVKEGEPLAMKAFYTPSKSTCEGVYVAFGHQK